MPGTAAVLHVTTVTMSLLDAICCTQLFSPPAHHLLSLGCFWNCTQKFSAGWCSSSVMKMNCDHESQWIGKKCLHPGSSCRTGPTIIYSSESQNCCLEWTHNSLSPSLVHLQETCLSFPLQYAEQNIWKTQNSMDGTSWRNQVLCVLVPPQCTATLKLSAWPCIQVNNSCLSPRWINMKVAPKGDPTI